MRHIRYGMRIVLEIAGLMLVLTSFVLRLRGHSVARPMFLTGLFLFITGLLLSRATKLKRCPRCADKVNVQTIKCKNCGFDFPATVAESLSEPFYK